MSGYLCTRWPGGADYTAYSFQRIMFRRVQTAAEGLMPGCLYIHWPGGAVSPVKGEYVIHAAIGLSC